MTSFTKALYRRDPAAAKAFYQAQTFEHKTTSGRHPTLVQFSHTQVQVPVFGKRVQVSGASHSMACARLCGHPACSQGCTLPSR